MNQTNLTFNKASDLTKWAKQIAQAYAKGTVCIIRAGYGGNQYAMLNVNRWNPTSQSEYNARLENNGLPANWTRELAKIIS
jgi:hypothetical protein